MYIGELRLVNFRSYDDATVAFAPGLNVIVGRNASGKTNLLEGAFFALRAASCRTNREEKTVRWGAPFARVEATIAAAVEGASAPGASDPSQRHTTTVAYAPGQGKQVRVDGVEVETLDDLRRQATVLVFVPESLLLVKGAPARRRAHLDAFAAACDRAYAAALRDLNEALRQRNAQLALVRDGSPAESLDPWDRQVARCGLELGRRRRDLVARLAARFADHAERLAPDGGRFEITLVTQLDDFEPGEDGFLAALAARRQGDVRRAITSVGPHRDDVRFTEATAEVPGAAADAGRADEVAAATDCGGTAPAAPQPAGGRDLRLFGSQGEQRAAVLALLLAERDVAAEATGEVGALLLDDVMSELDDARRRLLVGLLSSGGQAIVTTTNRHYFTDAELAGANVITIGPEGPEPELPGDDDPVCP